MQYNCCRRGSRRGFSKSICDVLPSDCCLDRLRPRLRPRRDSLRICPMTCSDVRSLRPARWRWNLRRSLKRCKIGDLILKTKPFASGFVFFVETDPNALIRRRSKRVASGSIERCRKVADSLQPTFFHLRDLVCVFRKSEPAEDHHLSSEHGRTWPITSGPFSEQEIDVKSNFAWINNFKFC